MSLMGNVKSLQELYVALGGALTDTYEDIADGVPVSDITTIADMIQAVSKKAGGGGGGSGETFEFPVENEGSGIFSTTVTPNQFKAAIEAGKTPKLSITNAGIIDMGTIVNGESYLPSFPLVLDQDTQKIFYLYATIDEDDNPYMLISKDLQIIEH